MILFLLAAIHQKKKQPQKTKYKKQNTNVTDEANGDSETFNNMLDHVLIRLSSGGLAQL